MPFTREVYERASELIKKYLTKHEERKSSQIVRYIRENLADANLNNRNISSILLMMEADGNISINREALTRKFLLKKWRPDAGEILHRRVKYFSKFSGGRYVNVNDIIERLNLQFAASYTRDEVREAIIGLNENGIIIAETKQSDKEIFYRFRKPTTL